MNCRWDRDVDGGLDRDDGVVGDGDNFSCDWENCLNGDWLVDCVNDGGRLEGLGDDDFFRDVEG